MQIKNVRWYSVKNSFSRRFCGFHASSSHDFALQNHPQLPKKGSFRKRKPWFINMNKFNPNFYKDLADDSAMIQAAVDEAAKCGETVTIPRFNERRGENLWDIPRAIELHTGSVVCLDNCIMRLADDVFDNMFRNSNYETPAVYTREGRQYDIRVYGVGNAVLMGGKQNGHTEATQRGDDMRPMYYNSFFNFMNCERITIENIRMLQQRYWALTFHYCSAGRITNIDFYANWTAPNQDGIDLRTGCNNFIIENITGVTGDDVVALTCLRSRYDEAMKAAGLDDAIHHVTIRNIRATTIYSLVRLLNHGGKLLHNIIIENISETAEHDPAHERCQEYPPLDESAVKYRSGSLVRIGENHYNGSTRKAAVDETFNIVVRNVQSRARTAIRVSNALNNAHFENIQVYGDGGSGVYFGEGTVKNITIKNVGYSMAHTPCPTDDNRIEGPYNNRTKKNDPISYDRKLGVIYFKETTAENITFDNIRASANNTAVFAGNGHVTMSATNIIRENQKTPLFDKDLSVQKMQIAEF